MKHGRFVLAIALAAILPGAACQKDTGSTEPTTAAARTETKAKTAPAPAPVATAIAAPATAAAAGSAEEHSCGQHMAEGEQCSGGCDQFDKEAAEVAKRKVPTDAVWQTIPVSGMVCGGCERRIVASVGQLPDVLAVEADAELGQVRVAMAPGKSIRKAAVDRINSLGYSAR